MTSNRKWLMASIGVIIFFAGVNKFVDDRVWDISPMEGTNAVQNIIVSSNEKSTALTFDITKMTQTLAHPLFARNRKPFVKKVTRIVSKPAPKPVVIARKPFVKNPTSKKPEKKPIKNPEFKLSGIMMEGDLKRAYLSGEFLGSGRWINDGETFDEWTMLVVDGNTIKLSKSKLSYNLWLYK
ncbi:MAG: hypothetical protein GY761_06715 [Hyphomicrobiales bacterium]|nr:hypothetical protein [Hyphomicrobiales bacterium]